MGAVSGQYGKVTVGGSTLVECTKWSFDRKVGDFPYGSCATGDHMKRVTGRKDGTGTIEGVLDPDDAIEDYIEEGDYVTLRLYYTASKYHSVPAVITGLSSEVDIEGGAIVRWKATFGIDGAYVLNQGP